jgi:hypothetical protein
MHRRLIPSQADVTARWSGNTRFWELHHYAVPLDKLAFERGQLLARHIPFPGVHKLKLAPIPPPPFLNRGGRLPCGRCHTMYPGPNGSHQNHKCGYCSNGIPSKSKTEQPCPTCRLCGPWVRLTLSFEFMALMSFTATTCSSSGNKQQEGQKYCLLASVSLKI